MKTPQISINRCAGWRYGFAHLNQWPDIFDVGRGGLIVDVDSTLLEGHPDRTASLVTEDGFNVQTQHIESQQGNDVQGGRPLGGYI
jgi:hypothetical protein